MSSLNALQLESNSKNKINFEGGDLSSDSGLLLVKEFAYKFGFHKHVSNFKTDDKTIRLKLLKIASKIVKAARYIHFKLCSSCPYKDQFYETLENIRHLP